MKPDQKVSAGKLSSQVGLWFFCRRRKKTDGIALVAVEHAVFLFAKEDNGIRLRISPNNLSR
jgi:hypothetical protein